MQFNYTNKKNTIRKYSRAHPKTLLRNDISFEIA